MASTTRRLLLQSRRSALSLPTRATPQHTPQWQRALSTTPARSARSRDDEEEHQQRRAEKPKPPVVNTPQQTKAQLKQFAEDFAQMDPNYWKEAQRKGQTGIPILPNAELLPGEFDELPESAARVKQGFWAEGEESMGPDEDYHADDITSDGDGVLQQHRYLRKYARLVAWELPLLSRTFPPIPSRISPHEERLRMVC
jgi:small subunit ribosomal protein S35